MNIRTLLKLSSVALFLVFLNSCYKLQSDEELREDIIGTWHKAYCKYPNNLEEQGVTEPSPLRPEITFYSDGSFSESGYCSFCSIDTCGSCWNVADCGCFWTIQAGSLIILPDTPHEVLWLNQEFPIKRLHNDRLVFDNTIINGDEVQKVCYERK